jgi:CheY-like chemotaxis protein
MLPLVVLSSGDDAQRPVFDAVLTKPVKMARLHGTLLSVLSGAATKARQATPSKFDPATASRMPMRLLLAEDNAVNQKVALHLRQRLGYRADAVTNGLEAVDAVKRQTYDVVWMDVQMPEMDGLEATRCIRRLASGHPQPRIIAMTANARPEDRQECLDAGMDDFISKPVQIDAILTALTRAWESRSSTPVRVIA